MYFFLADAPKARPLWEQRNVAVHLAIYFDAFYHIAAVGFQTTVEIVELDARKQPCNGIEKLGRNGFGERVVALKFPTRYHVEALFANHTAERRNLLGVVLQVGI